MILRIERFTMDSHSIPAFVLKFTSDLKAMSKTTDTLTRILPHWISSRLTVISCLEGSLSTCPVLSPTLSTVFKLGRTVQDAPFSSKLGVAFGAVLSVITFGIYKGYKKAISNINKERLDNVAEALAGDYPETKYVEKLVTDLLKMLDLVIGDLEEIIRISPSDRDELPSFMQREIDSILAGSSDSYKLFLECSHRIRELLNEFLTVLKESMVPNSQISSIQNHSTSSEVLPSASEILEWIKKLGSCLLTVETARNEARGTISSANNSLTTISNVMSNSSTLLSPVLDALSANGQTSTLIASGSQEDQNLTHDIDQWFRQVLQLYTASTEVAQEVLLESKEIVRVRWQE